MDGNKRAIIVGAGPGGLAAAIALGQAGFDCGICERAIESVDAGSGLTLWPNAMKALGWLGLADAVHQFTSPWDGIAMRSWRGELLFEIPQDSRSNGVETVCGAAMHRADLLGMLLKETKSAVRRGVRVVNWHQDAHSVAAMCEDGTEIRGDLLIGADGIRSLIRHQLFGPKKLRYAGYTVWRGVVQFRLKDKVGLTTMGRGSQFGLFPMAGERVYWFGSANAPEGDNDSTGGCKRQLLEAFRGWHEPIREVIEATDEPSIIRNDIYDLDPLPCWTVGRV